MPQEVAVTALEIAACLSQTDRTVGEAEARRLAFRIIETLDKVPETTVDELVAGEPGPVGDARFDAMLAALVEHGCTRRGRPAPMWVNGSARFLETWWFVSGIKALHPDASVHSPISFARRGVFITSGALSYV